MRFTIDTDFLNKKGERKYSCLETADSPKKVAKKIQEILRVRKGGVNINVRKVDTEC